MLFWRVRGSSTTCNVVLSNEASGSSNSRCLRFQGEKNLRPSAVSQSTKTCRADLLQSVVGRGYLGGGPSGFYYLDIHFSFYFTAVDYPK